MSLVKIQGNASGTGTFTVAAPNSNNNQTLTLPDETGTVTTTGSTPTFTGSVTAPAFVPNGASVPANGMYLPTTSTVAWSTATTERARITSTGNLLINTTSNVYSTARAILQISVSNAANDTGLVIKHTDATGVAQVYAQRFLNASGTEVGSIKVTSSDTQYVTSSDRRLKENIAAADDAGKIIDAIEIIKYDWKSGGHVDYGVIAQDLHTVAPEVVSVGDNEEEIINTWGVDYSKLVPILIKEVQSLRQRIAAFEARLAALESK